MDTEENKETSLREDIVSAIAETKEPETVVDAAEKPVTESEGRDEKGRFKTKEAAATEASVDTTIVAKPVEIEPPASLTPAMKAKWKDLPEEARQEWSKREADMTKLMTSSDSELRLGREMKDVVTPYLPIIQAEGGTPVSAVKDLLNTAYILRTGTPQAKAQLLRQVAQQYGVDLGQPAEQESTDPTIADLQRQIAQLTQAANPQALQAQLQAHLENERILNEVKSFSSDPANKHYEQVKAAMAPLLGNGVAKDMKEAYDMACWASPAVRSTLIA